MRISTLTEDNETAVTKRPNQLPNNKVYKNYNNINNGSNNSKNLQQQQQQHVQQELQQQQYQQQHQHQKTRTFPKVKYLNSNNNKIYKYHNNNNNSNNNNNNNNSAHYNDGNYINGATKNPKRVHYETNFINNNISNNNNNNCSYNNNNNTNSIRNNNTSCNSTSSSRNSSPSHSLTDESISNSTTTIPTNTQNRYKSITCQQQQQPQQPHYNKNNSLIRKQNLYSSTDAGTSKMIENPITPTIYSATWETRNTNMIVTVAATNSCNDDNNNNSTTTNNNNNNENKIYCKTLPPITTTPKADKATVVTPLSLKNRRCSPANRTQDLPKRQQEQQQHKSLNIHLSNAKVSSIEYNSPKYQRRNSSSSQSATATTNPSITISQIDQQEQKPQQSSSNDCSNSYQIPPRTQSTTTARTKSSSNPATASSSSSIPFPLGSNGTNNNNTEKQEYGSKGGGGGGKSHHFNRKKFWKLSSANTGGTAVITTTANSAELGNLNSGANTGLPTANGTPSNTVATAESNIVINSASPKPTNRTKNSNSRNNRYQPQSQSHYPETWKKNAVMSTTVTSTVTRSTTANPNAPVIASATANKSAVGGDNAAITSVSTMTTKTTTANTSNTAVSVVPPKSRAKQEEKSTSDASTTTEKMHSEENCQPSSSPQPQLPTPLSPIKNTSLSESEGSVNRNCPSGMPSYTLDFLHSVGKRMLNVGTAYPPTTGNRISSSANNNSNATGQSQQSNHRANRYVAHNNSGYGHSNQHHHHHPQPQQLTIASFLQKDMFAATASSVRGAGNSNTGNNNSTSSNGGMSTENSPHSYNNQAQYQQHRFHNFYNHPPSTSHYYRHQGIFQAYNGQNGMIPTGPNGAQRYHTSNNNASAEHNQRQPSRNQQQRQHMGQQPQYGGNHSNGSNNFNSNASNRKQKMGQQSKSPNAQNASSPSSSTSSLSSLTSTTSSHVGGSSRQSNGSNKSNSRPNSAMEMMPLKNNAYPVGPNAGGFRHSHRHNGHHFNHHVGTNVPPPGAVMSQHQNFNNLTYVITNGNGSTMGPPPAPVSNLSSNSHAVNTISTSSETSSRACSPSALSSSDNQNPELSQTVLLNAPNRFVHPDQQAYILSTQNLRPTTVCPHITNVNQNDVTAASKNVSAQTESACNDFVDSECSSSQQSEDGIQHCNSSNQSRPTSSLAQPNNSQVPSSVEYALNPIIQQIPPAGMHFQPQPYRNGMIANLPPNGFHEDDFHLQGAIQQQLPSMFFTSTDQINAMNGHNSNGFPNSGNVVYSQSAMTLIPTCPSIASNRSRSSEDESQMMSSRSSSSGSDHPRDRDGTPENSTDVLNEMHDQMGGMNRVNSGANTLPSARSRSARNQPHSHPIPPPFLHYPFNQQSMFCSNYLAYLRSTPSNTSSDLNANTPPDRFMSRSHLVEVRETPSTLLNNSKWDNLSQQIWGKFIDAQQTEETFKLKMRLWRYLYITIKQTYPRYGLYLVGSTMSGFGADTSDVDMCLVSRSFAFVEQRMEALFNLTILRECLRKTEDFESFNLIEAKVPILRFRDKSNHFEVDLNFNNSVGIKNTHLLYCYTQLDWRLRPLALIVKLWAQYHDINNAKNMTISSYSLVLLVIHFLQCGVSPPVLPCLHKMFPDKFTPLRSNEFGHVDMNDNVGPYESKNTQALGELFLNFLEYYSSFDYRQNAISVRTGGLLPVNVCRQAKSLKNDIHQWKELCIEEPFDLTNTARSVYDFETFERVKAVFTTSFHVLQKTLELNSIFAPLVLPRLPISARIYMKRTTMPNSSLIPKMPDAENQPPKSVTNNNNNEKSIDYVNEQKSNVISTLKDDQKRIEEKTAGRGDATPATAL